MQYVEVSKSCIEQKLIIVLHSFILYTKKKCNMEYVYAALMLHKLKKDVTEENITSIVKASGVEVNEAQVKSLVASLADVDIEEAIKAAPVAAAAPAAAPAEGGEGKKEDKKQDEAASAKSEEKAMEGLSSLFG